LSKILMNDRNSHKSYKKILVAFGITLAFLVICIYVGITKSGHWLVEDDEFNHADWVVVLDGQSADMERSDYAADLLAKGKVDSVMLLGRRIFRDKSNADFYAEDFMSRGSFDSSVVFLVRHDDPSTIGEAYTIIPWLKARKADTVVIVTAAPASSRAKKIFTHLSGEKPVFLTVDIENYQYNADSWLFNREARKSWLREWAALINSYYDLFNTDEIPAGDSKYMSKIRSLAEEKLDDPIVDLQKMLNDMEKKAKETKADTAAVDTAQAESSANDAATKADSAKQEP